MASINIKTQPSCQDGVDTTVLSVTDAQHHILQDIKPLDCTERVALRSTLNRILAEDIISPINVPAHTNSAMDGYAISSTELPTDTVCEFTVIGTAWAGKPFAQTVQAGEAVRIMTGAMLPKGTDTVIMQEHVERSENQIRIAGGHRAGQNVRYAGEDLNQGEAILHAGKHILPAELGLLASLGIGEVSVERPLRVAFFSTGDELRSISETLEDGQIYDSNRYTIYGMLTRLGVAIIDMGVVRDERAAIRQAFITAAEHADAVITSGGVSVGEADYVKEIVDDLGEVSFWKIAMKPGRPLAYGRIGKTHFFGLPGNPVSVMVTFYQFVQPALQSMMGQAMTDHIYFRVRCDSSIKKRPGRTEFQRGILESNADGDLRVRTTGQQGSGILRSMSLANCFIILPDQSESIEAGDLVEVQPFSCMM